MDINDFLGPHPDSDSFGCHTKAENRLTNSKIPHRALTQSIVTQGDTVRQIREALVRHHVSAEMIERDRRKKENLQKLGYTQPDVYPQRFPCSSTTRKGNLAEVFLAEYIVNSSNVSLPIYRLRFNPNIEQSMKGDDVLAFDLDSNPIRIIVGEAKFRGTPSKAAVQEIVEGLVRSHRAGLPASLQFVADRLFETGHNDMGQRIEECALLMAKGKLNLYYVGLLMSNDRGGSHVDRHTSANLRKLAMISVGFDDPNTFIDESFEHLEKEIDNPS